jgi:hypothetical protein
MTLDPSDNFLEYVPERTIEWALDEKGRVYLIKRKSKNRIIRWLIDRFGRSQFFHIHLDEIGSEAWSLAGGDLSLLEISRRLRGKLGARIEPAEQRVAQFFAVLKKNGFVDLNKNGTQS